jgi:hypothetical protein
MKTIQKLTSIKQIKDLEKIGVVIEFTAEEEEISPSDNMEDQECINYVIEQYNSGNMAAWFCAKVEVKYKGFEAEDYLGCCSYKSFNEFTTMDKEYYMDMINQCIEQINKDILLHNAEIQKASNIRCAKKLIAPYNLFIVSSNQLQTL